MSAKGKIGIVGSGKIGRCWAVLFGGAGYDVMLHDVGEKQLKVAFDSIKESADQLNADGLLKGSRTPAEILASVSTTTDLAECLKDSFYIQECVFEDFELKKEIFKKMDAIASQDQILASSTSALPASEFSADLKHKDSCLVVHPVNPPFLCPLVEIIPAPWTRNEVADRAFQLMNEIGQSPVRLNKEVVGFAVNRLQYAICSEAFRLVRDGVMNAEDVDKVVSEGLGHRWAFLGPLEVMSLNGNGIQDHNFRYGRGFNKILADYAEGPDLLSEQMKELCEKQIESRIPVNEVNTWRDWRDKRLIALAKLKREMGLAKPDKTNN